MHLFFRAAEMLARGEVPDGVASIIRRGRMTALQKPAGGVRGIVAGDIVRRSSAALWSRPRHHSSTHCQLAQVASAWLQALSEVDERATIISIDGISAYDLISRREMSSNVGRIGTH